MQTETTRTAIYGVLAEFANPSALLAAAQQAYQAGYRQLDAFTPFPVHDLAEAMGHKDRKVQLTVLAGGIAGLMGGLFLCYWTNALDIGGILAGYPNNVGGRPLNSWPAFIVPTFETTILVAGLTSLICMLIYNGLPMPYHPVFNVARFRDHASQDGFFLCIEATDPKFDARETRQFLEGLGATGVNDVAH